MARTRRAAAAKPIQDTSADGSTFTCPECGKTFTRAASLGAHRSRAHGVAGASARRGGAIAQSRRKARRESGFQPSVSPRRRRSTASAERSTLSVNRDHLLQTLFPNGLPAREAIIRQANAWLDEAERLARTR